MDIKGRYSMLSWFSLPVFRMDLLIPFIDSLRELQGYFRILKNTNLWFNHYIRYNG